jgi:hypothetical protein
MRVRLSLVARGAFILGVIGFTIFGVRPNSHNGTPIAIPEALAANGNSNLNGNEATLRAVAQGDTSAEALAEAIVDGDVDKHDVFRDKPTNMNSAERQDYRQAKKELKRAIKAEIKENKQDN